MLPRIKVFSFTVKGSGQFPLDMLRYDQCWPTGTDDASKIETSLARYYKADFCAADEIGNSNKWEINLTGANGWGEPTPGRWESFNCRVTLHP